MMHTRNLLSITTLQLQHCIFAMQLHLLELGITTDSTLTATVAMQANYLSHTVGLSLLECAVGVWSHHLLQCCTLYCFCSKQQLYPHAAASSLSNHMIQGTVCADAASTAAAASNLYKYIIA
eukprot:10600-Heterococcus_DN1.PRE.1